MQIGFAENVLTNSCKFINYFITSFTYIHEFIIFVKVKVNSFMICMQTSRWLTEGPDEHSAYAFWFLRKHDGV